MESNDVMEAYLAANPMYARMAAVFFELRHEAGKLDCLDELAERGLTPPEGASVSDLLNALRAAGSIPLKVWFDYSIQVSKSEDDVYSRLKSMNPSDEEWDDLMS